jgi:S-DNA-T family DNA segregation ATPase FtsK/SpoIIIE
VSDELPQPYTPGPPQPDDAETIDATPQLEGPPVDPPARKATFADLVTRADERRPIVPASLRSKAGRHALLTLTVAMAAHGILWQLTRLPLYLAKTAKYAPLGLWQALWRPLHWASAEEGNWHLRQQAANGNDAETWLKLDARRMRQSRWRWWVVGAALLALVAAVLTGRVLAPTWAQAVAGVCLVMLFARLGRPEGRPIIEHAFNPNRFIRLTAEMTRKALVTCGAGIKDPAAVKFNREIYRDGPGYTAEVSLPDGVIAEDVIDRRDYLSAGFQLPVAQVWPEPVRGAHPGVLGIWVADRPVDRMKQPKSPLLSCGPLDFWGPLPWGDDVRMRPLSWRMDGRNSIFGGMPATGKTLAARNAALGAAMDPLVRFSVSELKGSGDMDPIEPLCAEGLYVSGAEDAAKEKTMAILRWLDQECERRPALVRKYAAKGLNKDNSLNRAMAEADPSLFPLVAVFDEIQELLTDPKYGKEAKALLTSIVKRGRFIAIHLILATQRIDKESVPKGISSNVSNRCCLGVPSHVETDLILGTGAYKRGARPTTFVPPADGDNPWAGWGYLAGRDQPVRAVYIDNPTAAAIVQRALALRGDLGTIKPDRIKMHNLVEDVRTVWPLGDEALWLERILPRLAQLRPDVYGSWGVDQLGEALRRAGIVTKPLNRRISDDNAKRSTRVGIERQAVEQVLAAPPSDSGPAITS